MEQQGHVVDPDAHEVCAKNGSTEGVDSGKGENPKAERSEHANRELGKDESRPKKCNIDCCQSANVNHDTPPRLKW